MKRLTILATALAIVAVSPACKKGDATKEPSAAASATGSPKESPPVDPGTKFVKKPLTAGVKRTEEMKADSTLSLTVMGTIQQIQSIETSKKEEEILEATNNAITKLKVTFTEDSKSTAMGGNPAKVKPSAINGKTYVVVSKDGKLTVLNDKDKPASKAEAALVEKHYKMLGKPDPMLVGMPDRALKEGDDVPELAEALAKALKEHDEKSSVEGAKVSFKSKDGETGIFAISLTIKNGEGPFKVTVPLTGTMVFRTADAWHTKMDLTGPLTLELNEKDKKAGAEGGGKLVITASYVYR